jgi:hypothetical protein
MEIALLFFLLLELTIDGILYGISKLDCNICRKCGVK